MIPRLFRPPVACGPLLAGALAVVLALPGGRAAIAAEETPWQLKVAPELLSASAVGEVEFLIVLAEQADLSAAARLRTKIEKGRYVSATLRATAARSQGPILKELAARAVPHRSFWIANLIWVRGDQALLESVARRAEVARLEANPRVRFPEPQFAAGEAPATPDAIEWNITKVNADDVWALGFTGQTVTIAGQDTGYEWDHPALVEHYRGWDGAVADHNFHWHDAIHSGGGVCGANAIQPCDDHSHGTHTMGTMVGDDGGANQIGMAPGARWIGCRNMDVGDGTPTTYTECFQFFVAPTDLADQNPNPDLAPHVINNSWGCPASEGCSWSTLQTVVENTRAAGIAVVVSAGNGGSSCSTVSDPPAIYDASFSVGSTTSTDAISSFSSRGPVTVDGSNRLKPDISAPGSDIRSSVPGGGYEGFWSGTSMAGPHVAGLVALILSAAPSLAGNVDELERLIRDNAVALTSTQTCGGVPGSEIPNNTFGWGRIDALAAVSEARALYHIFSDGFESGGTADWSAALP